MLYCATKIGIQVNISDIGLNVLYDLIEYSANIDALTIAKANGKSINNDLPKSVEEMTNKRMMRG